MRWRWKCVEWVLIHVRYNIFGAWDDSIVESLDSFHAAGRLKHPALVGILQRPIIDKWFKILKSRRKNSVFAFVGEREFLLL